LTAGLSLAALSAHAESRLLDAPRAAGSVGERYDGYAVVRDASQQANLGALVAQVNAERRALYAQRAAADKATIDQVGRIYAAQILRSAPAGTWFLQESGQWVRK
jgi:uncharacterized protein YdbL (DUF1318 family)